MLGPAALLVGIQGAKIHRNFFSTEEDNRGSRAGAIRKRSVVERFTVGAAMQHSDAKYLEKHLRTNSALRDHADEIRQAVYARAL